MALRNRFFCLAVPLVLILTPSCNGKSWGRFWDISGPLITAFSINGAAGVIGTSTIQVNLKWTNVTLLTPVFSTTGQSVNIGGVTQVSGLSVNDFSLPKIYTVVGDDGRKSEYTVSVIVAYPFADTGQTLCYDGTVVQTCASVSGTFPRQDGHYVNVPWARSFTGPTQHPTFTADFTTKDNTTGLTWKSCSEGQSGSGCATGGVSFVNWATATDATTCGSALNNINGGSGYAGLTNWRLPTIEELSTLINYDGSSPAVDAVNFPLTSVANLYWSSSTDVVTPANAWTVDFVNGTISAAPKVNSYVVRCVSGGPTVFAPSRIDNGDGTITDKSNNLVWTKCSMDNSNTGVLQSTAANCSNLPAGTGRTWQQALTDCNVLTLTGRTWRLPSINELNSLVDYSANASVRINSTTFPNTVNFGYWASTTFHTTQSNAWYAGFNNGGVSPGYLKTAGFAIRCVASGP